MPRSRQTPHSEHLDAQATALRETAPPKEKAMIPMEHQDTLALAAEHLAYLGYEVRVNPDGWSFARHPYRYDFYLRAFAHGIAFHCMVGIGASLGNSRAAWLDFLNTANERAHLARFSLVESDAGMYRVNVCALMTGAYSRSVFVMVLDMWHLDLDMVRRKPEFLLEDGDADEEEAAAVPVN
jgi:hypothetical protein